MAFIDAWAKSVGIPSLPHWMYRLVDGRNASDWYSHHFLLYYDPEKSVWTTYPQHFSDKMPSKDTYSWDFFVYFPPTIHTNYLETEESDEAWPVYDIGSSVVLNESLSDIEETVLEGIPSSQIRQWMFYRR